MTETLKIIEALVKIERLSKQTRSQKIKRILADEYDQLVKRLDDIKRMEKASAENRPENLRAAPH